MVEYLWTTAIIGWIVGAIWLIGALLHYQTNAFHGDGFGERRNLSAERRGVLGRRLLGHVVCASTLIFLGPLAPVLFPLGVVVLCLVWAVRDIKAGRS